MFGSGVLQRVLEKRKKTTSKLLNWLQDEDAHNIFAFIGGYVDSAGYMKLQGLFTSSITGNLIAATASIYNTYGVVARICVGLSFCLGALLTSGAMFKLKMNREWSPKSLLVFGMMVEIVVLALTLLFGMLYEDKIDMDHSLGSWQLVFVASIMGVSMGAQCAFVKDIFPNCPSTTVVTMLVVTFSSQGAQGWNYLLAVNGWHDLHPSSEKKSEKLKEKLLEKHAENTQKFVSTTRQLVSFLVGGVIGAVIMENATFWSLLVPMVIMFVMILDVRSAAIRDTAVPKKPVEQKSESKSTEETSTATGEFGHIENGNLKGEVDSSDVELMHLRSTMEEDEESAKFVSGQYHKIPN